MSDAPTDQNDNTGTHSYRPELSAQTVTQLTRDLFGLHVLSCRELDSYDDRNFHITVDVDSNAVHNDHIKDLCPHGYVLKVLNSLDSRRPDVIEAKTAMMVEAVKKGFPTPRPFPSVSGQLSCLQPLAKEYEDKTEAAGEGDDAGEKDVYLVRLMDYLPGTVLASVPLTFHLSFQVGQYAARLDQALKGLDDSSFPELTVNWNLHTLPSLRHLIRFIDDAEKARVISDVISEFESKVLNSKNGLQEGNCLPMAERCAGLIHSDFNDHNILVQPEDTKDASCGSPPAQRYSVCAILDFGDSTKSFLIIEIAIAMNYMTLLCPPDLDPDEMSGHALAGYLSELSLSRQELELIPLTMCARFSHTLTFGFHRKVLDPENEYCLVHANKAWPHLKRLWTRPVPDTLAIWQNVAQSRGVTFLD